jgi:hypothetical protein
MNTDPFAADLGTTRTVQIDRTAKFEELRTSPSSHAIRRSMPDKRILDATAFVSPPIQSSSIGSNSGENSMDFISGS